LNFHRPSAQAETRVAANGKRTTFYKCWATPWEVFGALKEPGRFLKAGCTMAALTAQALQESDTESALRMQLARRQLFEKIRMAEKSA